MSLEKYDSVSAFSRWPNLSARGRRMLQTRQPSLAVWSALEIPLFAWTGQEARYGAHHAMPPRHWQSVFSDATSASMGGEAFGCSQIFRSTHEKPGSREPWVFTTA